MFNERGLMPRIAIASTIGAAWALAHCGDDGDVASVVLDCLPIAALRLSVETVASLEELGIYQIGQVAALPRETLGSRFGAELLLRLDQMTGLLPEAIVSHKPPIGFEAEWLLEHPTDRQETIDFVLETLLSRLTKQLAARREGVVQLECRFQLQTGEPLQLSVGLYRPSAAAKHLLSLVQLRLERIRLRDAVMAIRLRATATGALEMEQQDLFADESSRDAPRHLAALVDRLASRLGREAVLLPKLLADAQPEHACQYVPVAGEKKVHPSGKKAKASREGPANPLANESGLRPLQLAAPVALGMMAIVPEGPPIRFRAAGAEQRVVNAWGPERIETGWWRRSGVRRDYYRVETQTGQRFWLFRRLSDGRWFWHGAFE